MKKSFWLAAMGVAVLTSCSESEEVKVNEGGAISFSTTLDKAMTRANVLQKTNLSEFGVTAINDMSGTPSIFMQDVVAKSSDFTTWKPDNNYYWPTGGKTATFFAYAPTTLTPSINSTSQTFNYTPAQKASEQKDVVIARSTGTEALNKTGGVAMNFKHILSQIEVKALCNNANMKVEVAGVKLVNAATTGTFTYPSSATVSGNANVITSALWGTPTGSNGGSATAYYMNNESNAVTLSTTAQSIMMGDDNFMVIPQSLIKWAGTTAKTGNYLAVLCRITSSDGNGNETVVWPTGTGKESGWAYSAVAIGSGTGNDVNKWEPGKKYTYTLKFFDGDNGGGGKVDPEPTDPDPDGPKPVDPDPTGPDSGGDDIIGSPIKFTVTVADWVTATGADISM